MNKDKLSGLLDSNANIIAFSDPSNISGYTAEEVLGKSWFDVFIDDVNKQEILQVFSSFFHGDNPHQVYDNCIICKGGNRKLLQFNNTIIKNENENPHDIYIAFNAEETEYIFLTAEDT